MTIWLNGALRPAGAACVSPEDRGFLLGDGVFETLRVSSGLVSNGRPAHLERHLARLHRGAALLELNLPWSDAAIADAIASVLAADRLTEACVRITLTRGPAPRGIAPPPEPAPTLLVSAGLLPPPPAPARVVLCTVTRRNEASPLSHIKSLNYLDSILARQEAARRGADDAILRNTLGMLAEATAANLFVRLDGVWTTPPVSDGALPGVVRGLLIERCGAVERSIAPAELPGAEAAFLSSSLGLRAVSEIDGRAFEGRAIEENGRALDTLWGTVSPSNRGIAQ